MSTKPISLSGFLSRTGICRPGFLSRHQSRNAFASRIPCLTCPAIGIRKTSDNSSKVRPFVSGTKLQIVSIITKRLAKYEQRACTHRRMANSPTTHHAAYQVKAPYSLNALENGGQVMATKKLKNQLIAVTTPMPVQKVLANLALSDD